MMTKTYLEMYAEMRRVAEKFESDMRALQKAASMTQAELARVRERVIEMARQSPDSPQTVLEREARRILRARTARTVR